MRNFIKIGSIVCIAWFAAAALTPLTSVAIRNSTIDNTSIGAIGPSSGRFLYTHATSQTPAPLPSQGLYMGWNHVAGIGDGDFILHPGTGSGGFNWYQSNSSGVVGSAIMSLSSTGTLAAPGGTFNQLGALSPYLASPLANGSWIGWGQASTGEMDFIVQHTSGAGGFNWYDTSSPTNPGSSVMHLDDIGNLSARSLSVSAGLTGTLAGNASTASAFNHTPSACSAGNVSTGVDAAGNAICSPDVINATGTSCTTGSSSFSTCNSVVSWSPGFADNNYKLTCTMVSPSDPRASIVGTVNKFNGSANVQITNVGAVAVSFNSLDCMVQHN